MYLKLSYDALTYDYVATSRLDQSCDIISRQILYPTPGSACAIRAKPATATTSPVVTGISRAVAATPRNEKLAAVVHQRGSARQRLPTLAEIEAGGGAAVAPG